MSRALETSVDHLSLLAAAVRAFIESTSELSELLETVVRQVGQPLGAYCGVALLSDDGRQLRPVASWATDQTLAKLLHDRMVELGRDLGPSSLFTRVLYRPQSWMLSSDEMLALEPAVPPGARELISRLELHSVLHAPLRAQGRPVGLLSLVRYGKQAVPFGPEDVALAESLADHAAMAIQSSKLIAAERAARGAAELELARRRRAETALRKTEELLEAAPDAMVIVDAKGRIQLANGQAERLFGYRRDELLGQPVELLVPDRFRAAHPAHRSSYSADPRIRPMGNGLDLRAVRKDGTEFSAEISLSPMHDERGMLVTAAIRDVTDRKQLERKMLEASRLKSEFLANMSHELRTPLNAIIGFSELMHKGKAGPLSAPQTEYLGDVLASARHLLQLINDVLDLAKVESGKMEFRPEPTDLARVVNEIRDVLRGLFAAKRLTVEARIEVGSAVIDPARFKQILYNYLSNAIKFTGEHGRITIRIVPEGPHAFRLDVEDTGIGISPDAFGRLFVEFQQLDASSGKRYQGTGLGLALTRRIAEAHGGRVEVKSTPGLGSTFSAILPLQTAPESADGG
ncbi:MAG: PAS domain S-box protein [Archangiaceae bacterium]|nr:PAS domain S-box protein [Archangiaceae bacterium]